MWHVITEWQRARDTHNHNKRKHALSSCGNVWKPETSITNLSLVQTYQQPRNDMIFLPNGFGMYTHRESVLCVCVPCQATHIHRESESCISTHLSRDHYTRWFIVWRNNSEEASYQCHLILGFLHKIVTKKLKSTQTLFGFFSLVPPTWLLHTHMHRQTVSFGNSEYVFFDVEKTFTNWSLLFIHCYKVFISFSV